VLHYEFSRTAGISSRVQNHRPADPPDAREKTLTKAGLTYCEGALEIEGEGPAWNAMSLRKRVDLRMPSTTDSFEATHGPLDEMITRCYGFRHFLAVLFDSIADKTVHFDLAVAHDVNPSLRRSRKRSQLIPVGQMIQESAWYGTTSDVCGCADAVHLSSLSQTDIPWNHRYVRGAEKPAMPQGMEPVLHGSTETMEYSETV
jgi:hypothetical protein